MSRGERGGFSLIECLIGLSLAFFVILAALEFFGSASRHFLSLKHKEEAGQDILAALDKARIDILRSGQGLVAPMAAGALRGVEATAEGLVTLRAEKSYSLKADIAPATIRVPLEGGLADIKPGREVCLFDDEKAEVRIVAAVETDALLVSEPFAWPYAAGTSTLALLERVRLYLDSGTGTLRRKVNASSAQPLLEAVLAFDFAYDAAENLARLRLSLDPDEENVHESSVFPKNPALAGVR
jgi:type II secretory pathway pseudopilin PulG